MANISPRKRATIVTLHQYDQASSKDISKKIDMPQTSVSKIIKQCQTTGSVSPKQKGKCGCKRKTTAKDDANILKKSKQGPPKSSVEITNNLAGAGVEISATLVRKRLVTIRESNRTRTGVL